MTLAVLTGLVPPCLAQWEAERSVTTVVLWAEDGTSAEYKCSDRPVVRHDGDELVLTVNGGAELRISAKESASFTVKEDLTGVEQVEKKGTVEMKKESIDLSNLKSGTLAVIYDTNGRQVAQILATDGHGRLNTANLSHGIYVVKAGGITFKFVKP